LGKVKPWFGTCFFNKLHSVALMHPCWMKLLLSNKRTKIFSAPNVWQHLSLTYLTGHSH